MKLIWNGASRENFNMTFPIMKSEQMEDGRLMVEGIATSEALDHADEIVDYESAKSAFAEWRGNIREQHDSKKAVGKAIEVIADDVSKQIIVKAFISKGAPDTQEKIKDGTLSAFSIGGSVSKRKAEKVAKGDGSTVDASRIFVKRISETSVVDAGCNPDTAIAIVKADGDSLLSIGLEDGPSPEQVSAVNQLAEMLDKGEITPERLVELAKTAKEPTKPAEKPGDAPADGGKTDDVQKSMWNVQDFASALQNLGYICMSAEWDKQSEGDNSPVPAQLRAWLEQGAEIFKAMAAEELAEMLADLKEQAGEIEVVQLAAKGGDIAKAGAKFATSTKEALGDIHKGLLSLCDKMDGLGYKDADTDKAATGDDLQKVVGELDLAKAEITKLSDSLTKAQARVQELEALPAPGKALLKAIGKGDDIDPAASEKTVDPVKKADGTVDDVSTLIKSTHAKGGQVLRV